MNARLDADGNRVWDGSQVEMDTITYLCLESEFQPYKVGTEPYDMSQSQNQRRNSHCYDDTHMEWLL